MVEYSKQSASLKIILKLMTGNVVISEADALTYVVLSKAENINTPCGKLVGTRECITLWTRCRTNEGRCNGYQLYFIKNGL
jgi:hypothetical protein